MYAIRSYYVFVIIDIFIDSKIGNEHKTKEFSKIGRLKKPLINSLSTVICAFPIHPFNFMKSLDKFPSGQEVKAILIKKGND